MATTTTTVILRPRLGLHEDRRLYRLQLGWRLRLVIPASLHYGGARLLSNYPSRSFRLLQLRPCESGGFCTELDLSHCGPWEYRLEAAGSGEGETRREAETGGGFFQVEPPQLDSVTALTFLPKLLGPIQGWEAKLRVAVESGYNLIHLAPIQALGVSNSSYSIADQLRLNAKLFPDPEDWRPLKALVEKLRGRGVRCITDVVLNHTANSSPWLKESPDSAYNLLNAPHLRPAFLLDAALAELAERISAGELESRGVPARIESQTHLDALRDVLANQLFPSLRLNEFYQLHVDNTLKAYVENRVEPCTDPDATLTIIQDPMYGRLGSSVNFGVARGLYKDDSESLRRHLEELNAQSAAQTSSHADAAIKALLAHVHYHRVADWGPNIKEITEKDPLFPRYFCGLSGEGAGMLSLEAAEANGWGPDGRYIVACNGWVIGDDPLRNFAELPSQVYLRRELVAWGDCVKLRYGERPSDSPELWRRMENYVKGLAAVFDGFRLDNCHSTPVHVAADLLASARSIRPHLYVVAELFTSDEGLDSTFVNRLGLGSLVREAQNADSSHEAGRLVLRYGGPSLGSFFPDPEEVGEARPCVPHALFTDLTHDNPSFFQRRTGLDSLPAAALVAFTAAGSASTAGFDQLLTKHVDVVSETRLYPDWEPSKSREPGFLGPGDGILAAKSALNRLHLSMAKEGFTQTYVDDRSPVCVAVTRERPGDHARYLLVVHTAIANPDPNHRPPPMTLQARLDEVVLEAELKATDEKDVESPHFLVGTRGLRLALRERIKVEESSMISSRPAENGSVQVDFHRFPPGAIIVLRLSCEDGTETWLASLRGSLAEFGHLGGAVEDPLSRVVESMTLSSLHFALFRCEAEEAVEGGGVYEIPGYGKLLYAGLLGLRPLLAKIRRDQDLGHPLCDNLRQGLWLAHFLSNRLLRREGCEDLGAWMERRWEALAQLPSYLRPAYFEAIVRGVSNSLLRRFYAALPPWLGQKRLSRGLALAAAAFTSDLKGAELPPLAPQLQLPRLSISAGFPHFASGLFRSWGRDTAISLPGCLLVTGRFEEAASVLLSLGGSLRHGLIPNLVGDGTAARYNCRDAVWWWLYAIREYVRLAPDGAAILNRPVLRLYPTDDSDSPEVEPLSSTMQEALSRHWHGIEFRERRAGPEIDEHMSSPGFNVSVSVDIETGLIAGGNEANCGTWMDKMGGSDVAGNRGRPSTPRDGAAVELQGLAYAVLSWLASESAYPHPAVLGGAIDWGLWRDLIRSSFRSCFWIPAEGEDASTLRINQALVHRRPILKDTFGASAEFADYQLRPNFAIALAVAPQLLKAEEAWAALETANDLLNGDHLGMATLDPGDWAYRPFYNNGDQGSDPRTAQGANYHQGPEWLWVKGFFLRARLATAKRLGSDKLEAVRKDLEVELERYGEALEASPWLSLPELTNKAGEPCPDSCPAQAWSVATLLELVRDLREFPPLSPRK